MLALYVRKVFVIVSAFTLERQSDQCCGLARLQVSAQASSGKADTIVKPFVHVH